MSVVIHYAVEDANDQIWAMYGEEWKEAQEYAEREGMRVVAYEFEFSDSYIVQDYTKEGE